VAVVSTVWPWLHACQSRAGQRGVRPRARHRDRSCWRRSWSRPAARQI